MTELITPEEFQSLFDKESTLIDVRSPGEFESGAAPNSLCLPIIDNTQRAKIGLCYKENGKEAAIKLGHELVSGQDREDKLTAWIKAVTSGGVTGLYCARGGLRSQISQQWLSERGINIPRIKGGYKFIRRFLLEQLTSLPSQLNFVAVAGRTGVGKTDFIREHFLSSKDIAHIDLEKLANHRGSAFGGEISPQPRQAEFENKVAAALIKMRGKKTIIVEDESALIGACLIPEVFFQRIKNSPVVVLEATVEERIYRTAKDYVQERLQQYEKSFGPGAAWDKLEEYLLTSLHRIQKRLGATRTAEIDASMRTALEEHKISGDFLKHSDWIRRLLLEYYDPQYEFGLKRRTGTVIASGDSTTLKELLKNI